jgi:biopolymer transport protein ExbD
LLYEYLPRNMKQSLITYLFILLFSTDSCSQKKEKHTPTPPGVNPVRSIVVTDSSTHTTTSLSTSIFATSILISSDSIYCYRGADLKNGSFYCISGKNTYRTYVQKIKKEIGDSLTIILKPTEHSSYKTAVNAIDEMINNGIKKYAMVKLSDSEQDFLHLTDFNLTPPESVKIKTPRSVIGQSIEENIPYLLLTLTDEQTLFYEFKSLKDSSGKIQIKPFSVDNIYKTLYKIENDYKTSLKQVRILVLGHPKSRYPEFEKLINGLKKKELYKYNLVTSQTL